MRGQKAAMEQARKRGLARLMLRWPGRRLELQRRASADPQLMELCEAYEAACEAETYWTKSAAPAAPERAAEYRTLVSETEQDILVRLS